MRRSFQDLEEIGQLGHGGENGPGRGRVSCGGLDVFGRDPDEAHARAPGALAVAAQGIADEQSCLRRRVKRLESGAENRGIGLLGADAADCPS